ncbi:hypothetical protein B0H14DRAFT_3884747 [Mycena olivaceomarginata]|nr:hypothetical protein B0H14DRAFT_3884747 [Mycena olivaceomarginata]
MPPTPPSSDSTSNDSAKQAENGNFDKLMEVLSAGFAQLEAQSKESKVQSDRYVVLQLHDIIDENYPSTDAVETGFTRMSEQNKEQTERLRMAIEAQTQAKVNETANINTQPANTDIKTNFWTLYKTLADEQDKEFVKKYSADLENSLIFAGLFSAVTSAFIIQIQPEIQPEVSILVLVTQCLLYSSLGMTLLASLLTVLGKQWILNFSAAGEKGTIEARGIDRQKKLDGLRKWKFDAIMQTFPLLLQVALLLFATGLSLYLWNIHAALASIVLSFTALGFTVYMVLLASAAVSPDSPFQTPLTPLVTWLTSTHLWKKSSQFLQRVTQQLLQSIHDHPLPFLPSHPQAVSVSLFDTPYQPSPEVPAVSWVVEVSTNPHLFNTAVEMVPDLQWPVTMDLAQQVDRLHQGFLACCHSSTNGDRVNIHYVRDDMTARAISLGRAYCTLRDRSKHLQRVAHDFYFSGKTPELDNMLQILKCKPNLGLNSTAAFTTKWALRIIPSLWNGSDWDALEVFLCQFKETVPNLDTSSFADYLFCLLTFLSSTHKSDRMFIDKSPFQREMFATLFNILASAIKDNHMPFKLAITVIETTGRLASNSGNALWQGNCGVDACQFIIYQFCSNVPQSAGWVDLVMATALLAEAPHYGRFTNLFDRNADWVDVALGSITISAEDPKRFKVLNKVAGLLNALCFYYDRPAKTEHIRLVSSAFSGPPGDISQGASRVLLHKHMKLLFEDTNLRKGSLWSSLTHAILLHSPEDLLSAAYIEKGCELASISDWQPHIERELTSWILVFFRENTTWSFANKYTTVLCKFAETDTGQYIFNDEAEEAWGTSYAALNNIWKDFDFTTSGSLQEAVPWLYCLISVLLRTEYKSLIWIPGRITITFTITFSEPLHKSLTAAAGRARESFTENNGAERMKALNDIAGILEDIASKMPMTAAHLEQTEDYWEALRKEFDEKIDTLKESLQTRQQMWELMLCPEVLCKHVPRLM